MATKQAKTTVRRKSAFIVHRPGGRKNSISGVGLTIEVRDGALVVLANGAILYALAPEQWLTVNIDPA